MRTCRPERSGGPCVLPFGERSQRPFGKRSQGRRKGLSNECSDHPLEGSRRSLAGSLSRRCRRRQPPPMILEHIDSPADLRSLTPEELTALSAEIRAFIVDAVTATGGHLGSNLGVVELTLALHRTFDSPRDVLLWDTGHQAYVHKLVTGRRDEFSRPPPGGWALGLPQPRRVRARLGREQSRVDHLELRARPRRPPSSCRAASAGSSRWSATAPSPVGWPTRP